MPKTALADMEARLTQLEKQVEFLSRKLGPEAMAMLPQLDEAQALLARLQAEGNAAMAEQARLAAILSKLDQKAGTFLREIGGRAVLTKARAAAQPEPARWWWFLDERLTQRRLAWARYVLTIAAIGVAVVVSVGVVYQQFLAPPPAVREGYQHQLAAQQAAQDGDWKTALSEANQALANLPTSPDMLVLAGIARQQAGQAAEADTVFAQAEKGLGGREPFLLLRGENYVTLGLPALAQADGQAVLQINPQSAEAYLVLGKADEMLGNNAAALHEYDQAGQLGEKENNASLVASARYLWGNLSQRVGAMPLPTATPES